MSDITQTVKYESVIPVGAPDTKFQVFNTEKGEYEFLADFKLIRRVCEVMRRIKDSSRYGNDWLNISKRFYCRIFYF